MRVCCESATALDLWDGHPAGEPVAGEPATGVTFGGFGDAEAILRVAFSFRGHAEAQRSLDASRDGFDAVAARAADAWSRRIAAAEIETDDEDLKVCFDTALYRCLQKPVDLTGQSPWWAGDSPCVADVATLWDQYKTLVPLHCTLWPDLAANLINGLLEWAERHGGSFPNGIILEPDQERFAGQATGLACLSIRDAHLRGVEGVDYRRALRVMRASFETGRAGDFARDGRAHHPTHTLDLAQAAHATARLARDLDDRATEEAMVPLAGYWRNAYDADTGLLREADYYEGSHWNYAFRLHHAMEERIALAGGPERFGERLDHFFGFGAEPLPRPVIGTPKAELTRQLEVGRFEGLNNEPDMETMHAYRWIDRPERTEQILDAIFTHRFGNGRGGLPGNDDSGGLSSWFVWSTLGLFPVAGRDLLIRGKMRARSATLRLPGDREVRLPLPPATGWKLRADTLKSVAEALPEATSRATMTGQASADPSVR